MHLDLRTIDIDEDRDQGENLPACAGVTDSTVIETRLDPAQRIACHPFRSAAIGARAPLALSPTIDQSAAP